jgi:hypothetical protein
MSEDQIDEDGLAFFNMLDATLVIELDEPTKQFAPMVLNQVASPTAKTTSITMEVDGVMSEDFDEEEDDIPDVRPLAEADWNRVVLRTPVLRLRGYNTQRVFDHKAPDGAAFTVRDLVGAITETERQSRQDTDWFGGVDTHHVAFAGLHLDDDGVWYTWWDS